MTDQKMNRQLRVIFNNLNGVLSDVAWVRELEDTEERRAYIRRHYTDTKQKLADAQRELTSLIEDAEREDQTT